MIHTDPIRLFIRVPILPMPLLSQLSDPQLDDEPNIVRGPRKRRPTERLRENGDPLACKRARTTAPSATPTVRKPHSNPLAASASAASLLSQGSQGLDTANSSDNGGQDGLATKVIDVDDSEHEDPEENDKLGSEGGGTELDEDDDAELGESSCNKYCKMTSLTYQLLERLRKEWDAPIYVFFKPLPTVEYIDNRKAHIFQCAAIQCRARTRFVRRFLDKGDAKSTSNLRRHAKVCWGEEVVAAADGTRDISTARTAIQNCKSVDGSITAAFRRLGKGTVTYSHRQFTKVEAWYNGPFG
jgi:hypothetical protein